MLFGKTVRRWTVAHPMDDRAQSLLVRRLDAHVGGTRGDARLCPGYAVRAAGDEDSLTVELAEIPVSITVSDLDLEWACEYIAETLREVTGQPAGYGVAVPT